MNGRRSLSRRTAPINIRRLELIWAGQNWEKFYAPTGKTYRGYSPGICDRAKIKGAWLHATFVVR